jgi:septum formation protein
MVSGVKEIQPKKKHIVSSVMKNAERKVRGAHKNLPDDGARYLIIGADTLVTLGNRVIGKPADRREAKELLRAFSGADIDVFTGLFALDTKTMKFSSGHEKSSIRVKTILEKDMDRLFEKLGPCDKAGGFSIEGVGSFIFDDITGSYFNILGLPMGKLNEVCLRLGIDLIELSENF